MTNNLLQTVEEKVMLVLSEVEALRKEVIALKQENANLKTAQENGVKRLQGLVSLLDVLDVKGNDVVMRSDDMAVAV